jgi:uncharacterized protein (TIGR00255 family)
MTGFGAAAREGEGLRVEVEARSVNHRHLHVALRAPPAVEARLADVEALVRAAVARGSVTLSVQLRRTRAAAPARIVTPVLQDYAAQLRDAASELGLELRDIDLGALLRLPGVVEDAPASALTDAEFAVLAAAVEEALATLVRMREREGAQLAPELLSLVDELERHAARVERRLPEVVQAHFRRLRERLDALLAERQAGVPDELLAREVAVLADRSDVAEELQRLRSHAAQWRAAVSEGGVAGRRLDFLSQELGREANTLGAKSSDAEVSAAVVDLKVTVERLREQAANLE